MRHVFFMALATAVGLLGPLESASTKTCKCNQHKAEATGEGTCSLSETPDLCAVSFPEPVANDQTPAATMFSENLKAFGRKDVQFEGYTFATQNASDFQFKPVLSGSLATLALSSIPRDVVGKVETDFSAMFATDSPKLSQIVEDFNADGCVQAEEGSLRILIIAWQSEKNGRCE